MHKSLTVADIFLHSRALSPSDVKDKLLANSHLMPLGYDLDDLLDALIQPRKGAYPAFQFASPDVLLTCLEVASILRTTHSEEEVGLWFFLQNADFVPQDASPTKSSTFRPIDVLEGTIQSAAESIVQAAQKTLQ